MNHAVDTFGIATPGALFLPSSLLHQFSKRAGVTFLQQIAGLLPAKDIIGRHSPRSADALEDHPDEWKS